MLYKYLFNKLTFNYYHLKKYILRLNKSFFECINKSYFELNFFELFLIDHFKNEQFQKNGWNSTIR